MGFFVCLCSSDNEAELVFRSKLDHNWLHLGNRRKHLTHSQHTTTVIQLCSMCTSPEDFQHFLTKSPRALKIWYEASAKLAKSRRNFPGLGSLLHAISEWTLDPVTFPSAACPSATILDNNVAVALTSQSNIGWANLFRGFISADLGCFSVQDDDDKSEARDNLKIPRLALTKRALQEYSLALWTGRNAILHHQNAHSLSIGNALSSLTPVQCICNGQLSQSNQLRNHCTQAQYHTIYSAILRTTYYSTVPWYYGCT